MQWNIVSFEGVGPIRFGMSPSEVAAVVGSPESTDEDGEYRREYRAVALPIVSYENSAVTEIEAFHEVEDVVFRSRRIFDESGLAVLQFSSGKTVAPE